MQLFRLLFSPALFILSILFSYFDLHALYTPKMKLSTAVSALAGLTTASSAQTPPPPPTDPSLLFQNPDPDTDPSARRIPTSYESAVLGRRVLALTPLATLSTVFPASYDAAENRPPGLGGVPVGLEDYIADCEGRGDPTILAIRIATSFKNADAGSNASVGVSWVPPFPPSKRIESAPRRTLGDWLRWVFSSRGEEEEEEEERGYDPVPYSAANLPRFSLLGYFEPIDVGAGTAEAEALQSCFLRYHPDARYWLPGNRIHESGWVRLVVTQVYWIGGFGDRAYIGWIPVEEWRNVTREEWEAVRLPGEKKGWKEWSVEGEGEL